MGPFPFYHTPLRNNYIILNELNQYLFLYEHFNEIIPEKCDYSYLGKWHSKWTAIQEIIPYFNKITEQMLNSEHLKNSSNEFVGLLAESYQKYQQAMHAHNRVDFSHLQKLFYDLLCDEELCERIKGKISYIMVDEYQDTNYIQEQIFLKMANPDFNLCIVGDEDQALYRFRGATVRNILEFQNHFHNCKQIVLSINYRSHETIINSYNKFMNSINWMDSKGKAYRLPKEIKPNSQTDFPDYPSVFCIWGNNDKEEAERLASMIDFLKKNNVIEDYNQVALLLKSVRLEHSQYYSEALARHNIPCFSPRAKAYFEVLAL